MVYMSNTETGSMPTTRQRRPLLCHAGRLEEMRDRMRSDPHSHWSPAAMPATAEFHSLYPQSFGRSRRGGSEEFGTAYFDDELCHESFVGSR